MANHYSVDLELDSTQYLSITDGDQTGLDITGDFSFEAWVKLESIGAFQSLISKWQGGGDVSYHVILTNLDKLRVFFSEDGTYAEGTTTYVTTDDAVISGVGGWVHLAVTYDVSETTVKMYVNGVSVSLTVTWSGADSIYNGAAAVTIGAENGAANYMDGKMKHVRVWNDIRTPAEINHYYRRPTIGDEAGLVGSWKLENDLLDDTSNDNDLTNNNAATFVTDVPFTESEMLNLL